MSARRTRRAALGLVLAVALALASLLVSAGAAGASTRTEPLRARFENLLPGSTASTSWGLRLERPAVVTEVATTQSGPGDVDWDVRLRHRATGATTPLVDGATGARLAAGAYDLQVSVAVRDIPPAATNALDGHVVVTADAAGGAGGDGGARTGGRGALATTGGTALPLLLAAIAATLVGLHLLLAARRRREEDADPVPAAPADPASTDLDHDLDRRLRLGRRRAP